MSGPRFPPPMGCLTPYSPGGCEAAGRCLHACRPVPLGASLVNVVNLSTGKPPSNARLLASIDGLRKAAESGEIVAFVAAGLTPTDQALAWCGSVGGVTRLRMLGSIANLQHQYHLGALGEER